MPLHRSSVVVVPAPPVEVAERVGDLGPEIEALVREKLPDSYFIGRDEPYRKRITATLRDLDDAERRAVVVLVLLRWLDGRARPGFWSTDSMAELILAALRRRRLGWAADELVWLTRFLVAHCAELGRTVSITAHIVADGLDRCPAAAAQIGDDARRLADFLVADQRNPSPTSGYTDLSSLIARFSAWAGQDKGGTIPEHLLGDDDSFGARARAALLAVVDEAAAAQALELCAASGNAPRPSTRWRREVAQRAAARADVVDAARILASTVIGQPEPVPDEYGWAYTWISEGSEILIRGALWIARDELAGDDAVSLLRDIGAYCAQSALYSRPGCPVATDHQRCDRRIVRRRSRRRDPAPARGGGRGGVAGRTAQGCQPGTQHRR